MSFDKTPNANRLHITLLGRRNSGKSSLINALTGQETALVSPCPGTTTDPVQKAMEIYPLGPCLLIDTAGFDDAGELGSLRVERTRDVLGHTDAALMLFGPDGGDFEEEARWIALLAQKRIPVTCIVSKADARSDAQDAVHRIRARFSLETLAVSARTGENIGRVKDAVARVLPGDFERPSITGRLVRDGDSVLLVMPQDPQAPKGRLILAQAQTIRDLLDQRCIAVCCTTGNLKAALSALSAPPALIITDSQAFAEAYALKPPQSRLTSFSVLFAQYKGDIASFIEGSEAIGRLTEDSRVLIAEACAHQPLDGDIGRVKIPAMLRGQAGEGLRADVVCGGDFPEDLSPYDLIIHCGACMFTRRLVLTRLEAARRQGVPMTNYGVAIARMQGILNKIDY